MADLTDEDRKILEELKREPTGKKNKFRIKPRNG